MFTKPQVGFTNGKKLVDDINIVIKIRKDAGIFHINKFSYDTIDMRNALNSASWDLIYELLSKRKHNNSFL